MGLAPLQASPAVDTLLEASWASRGRRIRGRELRLEIGTTAVVLGAALALAMTASDNPSLQPVTLALVLALATAARVEFPIGAAFFTPTQLFLVPLFAVAPAGIVPLLVFCAFALAAVAAAATDRAKLDRLVFSAGDAAHALGPALVFVLLSEGDATSAGAWVIALAVAAQLLGDLASSSLHELLSMRAGPSVHVGMILQVWFVDLALGALGALAALEALDTPAVALAPLPLVALLYYLARDRVQRIGSAHERLVALEQERARREAAAELLVRQNQFLQDVSHELRTPVTIARGHVETLRRMRGPQPESAVVLDELQRIERIVERLLALARAHEPESIAFHELDAESFLEDRFVRWSDTIPRSWQLGDLAQGTLRADPDGLAAALDALVENAVKHTTPSQVISVASTAVDGALVIEVADGGTGIPAEALDRIFERFARADSARNRHVGGAGLGLAIVDAVARAHGGGCAVRSSPLGSTFTLRISRFDRA